MKLEALLLITLMVLQSGCDKLDITPEVTVNFQDPANVTETSFQVSWSINSTDYQSLTIYLAEDPSFEKLVTSQTFENTSTKGTIFKDLRGAATYYYRISLVRSPGNIRISETKSIEMPFAQESVSFDTPDLANLKGFMYYRALMEGKRPALLLMHEFGIFVNGWINSDMLKMLVAEGYICLVYYNRGHGSSSSLDNIQDLLDDPELLANDLRGALSFIQQRENVMADSIGLLGGSMGASMAVAGNGNEAVPTSVALSPANMHIHSMYPDIPLKSIFYLVGENDVVDTGDEIIDFPSQADQLYKLTEDPKKMLVIENSNAHGTGLLEASGVTGAILQWFQEQLPVEP